MAITLYKFLNPKIESILSKKEKEALVERIRKINETSNTTTNVHKYDGKIKTWMSEIVDLYISRTVPEGHPKLLTFEFSQEQLISWSSESRCTFAHYKNMEDRLQRRLSAVGGDLLSVCNETFHLAITLNQYFFTNTLDQSSITELINLIDIPNNSDSAVYNGLYQSAASLMLNI